MKIFLAHNLYYPYAKGGAEKVLKEMIENFLADNHQVFLISTKAKMKNKELEIVMEKNLTIYYFPSSYYNLNQLNKFSRFFWHFSNFYNPKRKKYYQKIITQEKPDLFITHNLIGLGFFLLTLIKQKKIKHQHFLHDIQLLHPSGLMLLGKEKMVNSFLAKIYQKLTRSYFKQTEKIISPSNWLAEEHLLRNFFVSQEIIIKPFKNLVISENIKKGNKNFLFVGQLEEHKGIIFLINTFKELSGPDCRLNIIGSGADEIKAKNLAQTDKRIKFIGKLNSDEVKSEMRKHDALIVPSLCYENSPTVIYEAQIEKLPVIAADIGGIKEIIQKNDQLFKAADQKDLLNKLKNF